MIFKQEQQPQVTWVSIVEELNHEEFKFLRPQPATEYLPKWFKEMPPKLGEMRTFKMCPAVPDLLQNAYVVPLWTDVKLSYKSDDEFYWETSSEKFEIKHHHNDQFLNHLPEYEKKKWGFTWKFVCPWRLITPKGWSTYQIPFWHRFDDFEVVPGSLRTDWYHEIHQQVLAPEEWRDKEIHLMRGTPLALYIPYQRQELKTVYSELTPKLKKKIEAGHSLIGTKFFGAYKIHNRGKK